MLSRNSLFVVDGWGGVSQILKYWRTCGAKPAPADHGTGTAFW
jgi:hypothetical protein